MTTPPSFKARGRILFKLAAGRERYVATAISRRFARNIALALNRTETPAPTAPILAHALRRLINCPALNLDDLEPEDVEALRESINAYVRATGENPAEPE